MTITLQQNLTAKNWTPQANVPATWGIGPRTLVNITIHWWGDPVGQTYAGILDWFCNPTSTVTTSAHFVASAGQVACIVSPMDAAWHAGSAYGNVHSIGIECNPRCSADDYAAVAWIVAQLRAWYGPLPLVPHNYWTSTTCPGDYRLDTINNLAAGITAQGSTTGDLNVALTAADVALIWAYKNTAAGDTMDMHQAVINAANTLDASIPRAGTRTGLTSLRQTVSYLDSNLDAVEAAAAVPATVTVDSAGVQSIADQLKAQLGASVVAAIAAQWAK